MSNFAEIIRTVREAGICEILPVFARHDITNLKSLRSAHVSDLVNWCLEASIPSDTIESVVAWQKGQPLRSRVDPAGPSSGPSCSSLSKRKDLPAHRPVVISKRSKLQIALEVASDPAKHAVERDRFVTDQWAASSIGPKESL